MREEAWHPECYMMYVSPLFTVFSLFPHRESPICLFPLPSLLAFPHPTPNILCRCTQTQILERKNVLESPTFEPRRGR